MGTLVLLRHGESLWNKEIRFTGWTDVDLSEKGLREAREAGKLLKECPCAFDIAFTSFLKKAIRTLWIVLDELDLMWLPVIKTWRLNERHYGALQGLNKAETAKKYGEEQVHMWRRSYDVRPPELERTDKRYPGNDPRYKNVPNKELPVAESLKDTAERLLPYWHNRIVPEITAGKTVLIAAHGNSLRALVKHLDNISDTKIVDLNIPTGIPCVYQLDEELHPLEHHYLGDPGKVKEGVESVLRQGKVKK